MSDPWILTRSLLTGEQVATLSTQNIEGILEKLNIDNWSPAIARFIGSVAQDFSSANRGPQVLQYTANACKAINKKVSGINWLSVYENLDYEEFAIKGQEGLSILIHCWRSVQQDTFPVMVFLKPWQNALGQLSVLNEISNSSPSVINLNDGTYRGIISSADLEYLTEKSKAFAMRCISQQSNCLDLLQAIIALVDTPAEANVNVLLNRLIQKEPELICVGLACFPSLPNENIMRLRMRLINMFLDGHENSDLVVSLLWQRSSVMLLEFFLDRYRRDPLSVSQILDIVQESKILSEVLRSKPYFFILDLASLAARRDFLNLDKWIESSIDTHGEAFIGASLEFWKQKLSSELSRRKENTSVVSVAVSAEVLRSFLHALSRRESINAFSPLFEQVKELCIQLFPNESNAPDSGAAEDSMFAPEIEEEVKQYFERLYNDEISVEQIAALLNRFKDSKSVKEQQTFACMVHTLLDEVRYFSNYPEKELSSTARLFGMLVQLRLVSYIPLRAALKHILDSVQQSPDSKLYAFGIIALSQIVPRLPEWPQYAVQLTQVESIRQTHPKLAAAIEKALQTNDKGKAESGPGSLAGQDSSKGRFSPVAVDRNGVSRLNEAEQRGSPRAGMNSIPYDVPPQPLQDRVSFIINNISQGNLKNKTSELREVLSESTFRWFSQYLVVRRVSIEPNYHQLYMQLLDVLDNQQLDECILNETYANIKILLKSEKTAQLSSERALLKNLGSWLGALTLAKDIPIRQSDISFQELLIEAYDGGALAVVIPFVCKVIEQTRHSKTFRPPNEWLMGVIKLLLELYMHADLKLNLKFEIEVMLNALKLNIEDVKPSSILENRFSKEMPAEPTSQPLASPKQEVSAATKLAGMLDPVRLAQFLYYNPALAIFNGQNGVKLGLANIVCDVLREIGEPVIVRSAGVAALSTKELVCKDFATEPDENSVRTAGEVMVRKLAANLAVVTSKEPLRNGLFESIQSELVANGMPVADAKEISLVFVSDNLDIVCSFVEKASIEKASEELMINLGPSFAIRRQYRESMSNKPFYDTAALGRMQPQINLPEVLMPTRGLTIEQRKVYNLIASSPVNAPQEPMEQPYAVAPGRGSIDHSKASPQMPVKSQKSVKCEQILAKVAAYIAQIESQYQSEIPTGHDFILFIRQLPSLITNSADAPELALILSQKSVAALYSSQNRLQRDCYSSLLLVLCQAFPKILKELHSWITYSTDERKYNASAVLSLIQKSLVPLKGLDVQLAQPLENNDAMAIKFSTAMIRDGLLCQQPLFNTHDFIVSISLLEDACNESDDTSSIEEVLDELKRSVHEPLSDIASLEDAWKYHRLYAEWIRLYDHPLAGEKVYKAYIERINQDVSQDSQIFFVRMAIEYSLKHYTVYKNTHGLTRQYSTLPIDAFAKLVEQMIMHAASANEEDRHSAKVVLGTQILSIIVLCMAQRHEQEQEKFAQKPFLRILSGVLMNICQLGIQEIESQMLTALSNTLYTLQPCNFPGFAFGWLQLISHRSFMPRVLQLGKAKGWPLYHKLVLALLSFLGPILQNGHLQRASRTFYRGTLRTLLVLLHDFPEFLCTYYWSICDIVPNSCVQLRNLILSAFPRNMYLPDPYSLNMKMGELFESQQIPEIGSYQQQLSKTGLTSSLNELARTDDCQTFAETFLKSITSADHLENGPQYSRYNITVINPVILHLGDTDITENRDASQGHTFQICNLLLARLDAEGCYLLLNAIANHMRFPNRHTCFFSSLMLSLFEATDDSQVKEQITRVLLDRLIVHRPHPWGLLVTFIELIKTNNFWDNSFTKCSPEIERLFQSVARSIQDN